MNRDRYRWGGIRAQGPARYYLLMMLKGLLTLVVAPLAGYPLFACALAAADTVMGERLVRFDATYERRLLLETFKADYIASLPWMLALTAALLAAAVLTRRWLGDRHGFAVAILGGGGAGLLAARTITGDLFGVTHAALLGAGALFGLVLTVPLRSFFATMTAGAAR